MLGFDHDRVGHFYSLQRQGTAMSNVVDIGSSVGIISSAVESVHELPFSSNIIEIPISEVLPSDSPPRTAGVNANHIRMLAESETPIPPIVIHRASRQIIDGWHRVRAAEMRGETTIAAVFFDGGAEEAFVLAVKLNAAHGLPLSLADRKAAALRMLASYGQCSQMLAYKCWRKGRRRVLVRAGRNSPRDGISGRVRRSGPCRR
jgi:hypothetical protein